MRERQAPGLVVWRLPTRWEWALFRIWLFIRYVKETI